MNASTIRMALVLLFFSSFLNENLIIYLSLFLLDSLYVYFLYRHFFLHMNILSMEYNHPSFCFAIWKRLKNRTLSRYIRDQFSLYYLIPILAVKFFFCNFFSIPCRIMNNSTLFQAFTIREALKLLVFYSSSFRWNSCFFFLLG